MFQTEAFLREEQLDGMHGERRALTAEILEGLGLRTRNAWSDATGPVDSSAQYRLRPSRSSGTGMTVDVSFEQVSPHMRVLHHGVGGGRRPPGGAALPRLLAASDSQPLDWQRPPGQQPRDIAPISGVSADNADNTTTTAAAAAAATPVVAVPVDRRPSEEPVMIPMSSTCPALEEQVTAAPWCEDKRGGAGAEVGAGVFGTVLDYRDARKVGRFQPQGSFYTAGGELPPDPHAAWGKASKAEYCKSPVGGVGKGEEQGDRGASPPAAWRGLRMTEEKAHHQHSPVSVFAPGMGKRIRGMVGGGPGAGEVAGVVGFPAAGAGSRGGYQPHGAPSWAAVPPPPSANGSGGGWSHETGSQPSTLALLQGGGRGGCGRATLSPPTQQRGAVGVGFSLPCSFSSSLSCATAEAAVAITRPSPPRSWGLESSGRRGGRGATTIQQGGGLVSSLGPEGSQWRDAGDRSHGAPGELTAAPSHDGDLYHDNPAQRGSPPRDQDHPWPFSAQDDHTGQGRQLQLCSPLSPSGGGTAFTPLRLGRGGCSGSEPGSSATSTSRPLLFSGVSDPGRPSLPGLAEVVATVGDQAAGHRISFGTSGVDAAVDGVDGGGGDAAAEEAGAGKRKPRRRRTSAPKTTKSKASTARGCSEVGCDRRPIYAYKGNKKPAYCARHRLVGMIDTRHPLCKNEQCTRQPSFGMEGDRRASFCAGHKKAGMVNVSSRRCRQAGCVRHPNFGFPGDSRASYCSGHRETGMVDIVSRRCQDPFCMRRPLYNFDGQRPVSCSQHKAPGMIDVVSTRCQEPGCLCHPSFGYASDKKARRCAKHRLDNMVGVKGHRQKRLREEVPTPAPPAAAVTSVAVAA